MIELLIITILFVALSIVTDYKITKKDNRKDKNGN